jgi:hypothetical protein
MNLHAKRKRIIQIINQHGYKMTEQQFDKAIRVWERLAKSSPTHTPRRQNTMSKLATKLQVANADRILDALQKAGERPARRWGQSQRGFYDPFTSNANGPAAPTPATSRPSATSPAAPSLAETLRASRDNTPLSGHQLAARRAGLDVNTPHAGESIL